MTVRQTLPMRQYYPAIVLSAIAAMGMLHAEEDQAGVLAAGAVLSPADYSLWRGEWLSPYSDLAENYYAIVRIDSVDPNGFTYETECRDIPYGPNTEFSGEKRVLFLAPRVAQDAETGAMITLRINPDDRHDRVLEFPSAPCLLGDVAPRRFLYQRSVYRAGFDCARAATAVEHAICGNELIARGDLEVGELYRELGANLPENRAQELRTRQRAWLRLRNDRCTLGEVANEACLANLYADRLAALARMADPHLGDGNRFDSIYALARIVGGADLRFDTAARLAMYPLRMDPAGVMDWRAGPDGLLLEWSHVKTRVVGPSDVDFRYSDMLYVDRDVTVWTVEHTETAEPLQPDSAIEPDRLWLEAGRDPLTVRTEAESTTPYPPQVARWLHERGVAAAAR